MTPEVRNLIAFLRQAGYPGIAQNFEDLARIASEMRGKAQLGLASSSDVKFLQIQANLEEFLKSLDWLDEYEPR